MRHSLPLLTFTALVCAAAAPLALAQQVYKWTDDKGVVNYSNSPPADARAKKGVTVVEDRVSVYSSDPAVIQATQNARARSGMAAPPQAPQHPVGTVLGPPTPPVAAVDPCLNGYDSPDCGYYGGVPLAGRRRPQHLVQPTLPPGAIAGNANQNSGFIPGLSTPAQSPVVRPQIPQTARARDLPTR